MYNRASLEGTDIPRMNVRLPVIAPSGIPPDTQP